MKQDEPVIPVERGADTTLQNLASRTAYAIGQEYFCEVVRTLAEILDVSCVFIAECLDATPSKVRTLALYARPAMRANIEYELEDTPCAEVIRNGCAYYPSDLQSQFPFDQDLVELNAESYCGVALEDPLGQTVGHLCLIDESPMGEELWDLPAIKTVKVRCGAEIARLRGERIRNHERGVYESILNGAHDCMYLKDATGRFQFMNRAGALLNVNVSHVAGKRNADLFSVELAEALDLIDLQVIESRQTVTRDVELWDANEERRICQTTHSPLFDDGGVVAGIVGVARDVSEIRHAERLLGESERLASLGTIAAGIAHEINNPLTAIQLSAELAMASAEHNSPAVTGDLQAILESARSAAQIVGEVLRSSSNQPIPRSRCSVSDVVRKAIDQTRSQADAARVPLEMVSTAECYVDANPLQLRQVFVNLISNAIQATCNKETPVELSIRREDGFIIVRVHDYGVGVAAEDSAQIFDPFFTTRRSRGGTGLGLSVSRGIIAAHGGKLELGAAAQGTTFLVHLPEAT